MGNVVSSRLQSSNRFRDGLSEHARLSDQTFCQILFLCTGEGGIFVNDELDCSLKMQLYSRVWCRVSVLLGDSQAF